MLRTDQGLANQYCTLDSLHELSKSYETYQIKLVRDVRDTLMGLVWNKNTAMLISLDTLKIKSETLFNYNVKDIDYMHTQRAFVTLNHLNNLALHCLKGRIRQISTELIRKSYDTPSNLIVMSNSIIVIGTAGGRIFLAKIT